MLLAALLRIMLFVDGRVDLALALINRDLREGRLRAVLVAADGTITRRFEASDWRRWTVHAPLINPAEGARIEPYAEGRVFIWRVDFEEWYPTGPVTPATAADRQLRTAREPEPVHSPQAKQPPQPPPPAPGPDESVIAEPAPAASAASSTVVPAEDSDEKTAGAPVRPRRKRDLANRAANELWEGRLPPDKLTNEQVIQKVSEQLRNKHGMSGTDISAATILRAANRRGD
jgi:hypothetical protein